MRKFSVICFKWFMSFVSKLNKYVCTKNWQENQVFCQKCIARCSYCVCSKFFGKMRRPWSFQDRWFWGALIKQINTLLYYKQRSRRVALHVLSTDCDNGDGHVKKLNPDMLYLYHNCAQVGQLLTNIDYMMKCLWHGSYIPREKRQKFTDRWRKKLDVNPETGQAESKTPLIMDFHGAGMFWNRQQ